MKKTALFSIIATVALLSSSGCYYDVEEEIYPVIDCDTQNVTYSGTIQPILAGNCLLCHSAAVNTSGVTLEGYNSLMTYINNGRLLGAIKHQPGFPAMPQGAAQLPECDIKKIEQWITDGALNN